MFLRRTVYFKSNKKIRRAEKYKRDVRLFYLGLSRFFGGLEAVFGVGEAGKAGKAKGGEGGKGKRQKGMDSTAFTGNDGGRGRVRRAFVHCAALSFTVIGKRLGG